MYSELLRSYFINFNMYSELLRSYFIHFTMPTELLRSTYEMVKWMKWPTYGSGKIVPNPTGDEFISSI